MDTTIEHRPGKFSTVVAGQEAYLLYEKKGEVLDVQKTYTPPPLRGRDLAAKLTAACIDYVRDQNLRLIPTCSYTQTYLRRHPEDQSLVASSR